MLFNFIVLGCVFLLFFFSLLWGGGGGGIGSFCCCCCFIKFYYWTSVACRPMTSPFFSFLISLPCFLLFFIFSLVVIHRSSSLVRLLVCVCVCVWGGGGGLNGVGRGGTRLTPKTYIDMKWGMVLRVFIIIRNYKYSIIIRVVKHTGEDKDNLTQYICQQQHHLSNKL